MRRLRQIGQSAIGPAGLVLVMAGAAPAATIGVEAERLAFDHFIASSSAICLSRPAEDCVALGWAFADQDGDQGLSLPELARIRHALEDWALWRYDDLRQVERSGIALGLLLADGVGLEYLHAAYDLNGDGLVSRAELLADVRLDPRPLGEVLLDPNAVDRRAIARRLGLPPALLDRIGR